MISQTLEMRSQPHNFIDGILFIKNGLVIKGYKNIDERIIKDVKRFVIKRISKFSRIQRTLLE